MRLWSAFWAWIWGHLYISLAVTVVLTVVCILTGWTSEAAFFTMCAGTLLMMKAEADRPGPPAPPPER
jgi:hypothetical protein